MKALELDPIALAQHTAFVDSLRDALRGAYDTWIDANAEVLDVQEISEAAVLAAVGEFAAEVLAVMLMDAPPKQRKGILRIWSDEVRQSVGEIVREESNVPRPVR